MTVFELIEQLSKHPGNREVGYYDPDLVSRVLPVNGSIVADDTKSGKEMVLLAPISLADVGGF